MRSKGPNRGVLAGKEPLDNASGSDVYAVQRVCYVLTPCSCLTGERYQRTAATNRSAGTSPTK
jgi:hypothetical protein